MPDTTKIRQLNDQFRTTLVGGRTVMTPGIAARNDLDSIIQAVRTFDAFDEDCDPHHEHDFSAIEINGDKIFWKIDYYNPNLSAGSPNPADQSVTCRVLTIMLSEEY